MAGVAATKRALEQVERERERQDARWGEQRHGMTVWLAVLQEEVGEAAHDTLQLRSLRALPERHNQLVDLAGEVTQIAAVAVAWLEHIHEAIIAGDGLPVEVWQ
jgi:NTP pyrophosphatase (non-canonical NTP hydrolase)